MRPKARAARPRRVKGAIVMNNERAPRGWVEIQREDDPSDVGLGDAVFDCDEDAAMAVAVAASMPGVACCVTSDGTFIALDAREGTDEGWPIVVVPASTARAAGLIGRNRELEAYGCET